MAYQLSDLPFFLALPALLVASGFFSGSETALFGLAAQERMRLIQQKSLLGRAIEGLLADQRALLVTLMLGNMTVNVLYFVISSALVLKLEGSRVGAIGLALATVAPLLGIIILGEVLPKLVANTARRGWVQATALPLYAAHRVIAPVGVMLSRWVVRPLGRLVGPQHGAAELSTRELEALLEMSQGRGVIGSDEQELLREVLQLSQRKVRDLMVPRVDIDTFDVNRPPEELSELIEHTRRERYVAVDGDIDHVLGVIYARQFLLALRMQGDGPLDLRKLVRGVRFVPELQRVDQLLADFRKTGTKLAIVVDEYGGTAGLVTLKDVVEQMVGELDMEEPAEEEATGIELLEAGLWRVGGRLSVHDWPQTFAPAELPPRVATVGGLVMAVLGRVPQTGDRVHLGNLELEAERVEAGRVLSVLVRLRTPPHPEEQGTGWEAVD